MTEHAEAVNLLLERVEAAFHEGNEHEARFLAKAALRHDPASDRALLWLIYLAEDGGASLAYLARLLDAHPRHPHAREAIRWARRRIPTSGPTRIPGTFVAVAAVPRHGRGLVLGLAFLVVLAGLGLLWASGRSPAASVQANASSAALPPSLPSPTVRPFMEILRVAIPLSTPTPTPTPTPVPKPTPTPNNAWVPVIGRPQTYNLSCESRSAVDLADYWAVTVDELEFLEALGESDNPHEGFVGDVTMPPGSLPPYGYGVYAEPVAAALRDYGLDARPVYQLGLDGLRAELLAGRPVLIWATYGMETFEAVEWTSSDGRVSTVVPFMHTFLVIGYDEQGVFVLDAYDAAVYHYPFDSFVNVWTTFDQMAVTVTGTLQ